MFFNSIMTAFLTITPCLGGHEVILDFTAMLFQYLDECFICQTIETTPIIISNAEIISGALDVMPKYWWIASNSVAIMSMLIPIKALFSANFLNVFIVKSLSFFICLLL